ncbi:hypothetical protein LUZ61_008312 [Rhynchospora tenuis]|uniref:FAD dependent oxidoreductase domain-containing protein n=1 Tax=Rhynchospora tenuis TaxID=198213 RepID=A0AAD6EXC5_9POAL|nr:hypothetical protein LUZ61_008312 [Rhynchospora tenuis]
MDASSSFDTIVIGAGIMGSCAAYYLSKLNQKILLLERFDLLHPLGSSHGHSRTTRTTYPESFYPPLVSLARSLYLDAQSEAGYTVLTPTPHLDMGPMSDLSFKSCIDNSSSTEHVLLAKESLKEKFSGAFDMPEDDRWVALETPLGGVLHPTKAVAMFQSLAARHGVVVRDRTEVTSIKKEAASGPVQVLTASGEVLYGKKVIVTAGAWTRNLVRLVSGIELPIEPVHTLICYWKIREGHEEKLTAASGFPTFASYGDPYIYGTPCLEYPNLIKIAMHGGIPCDPDRRDWQVGSRAAASANEPDANALVGPVAQWISKFMPSHVDASNGPVMTQGCMYSMTPDGDFIIDFLRGGFGKDVVIAGGFSGHGFKMGPAVGKILAEMAVWGEAMVPDGVEMGMFSIARFQSNPAGNVKEHAAQVLVHKT